MSDQDDSWPRWTVKSTGASINKRTNLPNEQTHTLLYQGRPMNRAKGVSGLNAMQKQAEFLNRLKKEPKREVECLADLSEGARRTESAGWDLLLKGGEQ